MRMITLFMVILFSLLLLSPTPAALADRGMIPISPELVFVSLNGSCAINREGPAATISLRDDTVFFSGYAIAPTPCHQLQAELVILSLLLYPQILIVTVDITAQDSPGTVCIQCIGEIPFMGEIRNLHPGEYHIRICYQGSILAQQRIEIPGEVEPLEFPPGTTLEVNPGEMLIQVNGMTVELPGSAMEIMIQAQTGSKQLRIEVDPILERIEITADGVSAITSDAIKIEDSQLFLQSPQGWAPVRVMPDEVLELLLEQEIQSLQLKVMDGKALFTVHGIAKAKLLGLFPIAMTVKTTIDALSGEIVGEEMPWWEVFCDLPQRGVSQ